VVCRDTLVTRIAAGTALGTVKTWSAETGEKIRDLQRHADMVMSVAYSPSGRYIASAAGEDDMTIKVRDTAESDGTLVSAGHTDDVNCIAFSPDGERLVSVSSDRTIRIWTQADVPVDADTE